MVTAIEFAVRDVAGGSQRGTVAGEGQGNFIQVGSGDSVSLNIARSSVVAYEQQGGDLLVKLSDGRVITLAGYFNEAPGEQNHLYLSDSDMITEVIIQETGDGVLYADYGPVQGWEKWSPLDDMRFAQADPISGGMAVSDEPAGMAALIPGLFAGGGGLGAAAAVAGGAALIGGGGGGGGRVPPTVDPQTAAPLTTNTTDPKITVTGTGQPGDAVSVVVGGQTRTTTIGTDGKWSVTYPSTGLPGDGTHTAAVTVTPPGGTAIPLVGPSFVIDMTPPPVETTSGTTANNDIENLSEYANGVSMGGTGEVGAKISVVIGGQTQTATVGSNGQWSVTFPQSQLAGGDYHEVAAVITATDALGNKTVINRLVAIDTVPHPITVTAVGGDNLVNLNESQSGFAVTGTSTAGAEMTVTIGTSVQKVICGADGRWTASFGAGTVTTDGTANVTVATVDRAGNASSTTFPFRVDTTASLAVNTVAGNDQVNKDENGGVMTVTGTAEVGSTNVMVSWNGTTLPATVNAATGAWSVNFPANLFGSIQSTATNITVTATDAAGNAASASRAVNVDTLAQVAMGMGQIGGDDRLVASEAGGFTLTGTSDANARITVVFEGQTVNVTADGNGNWSAPFSLTGLSATTRTSVVNVTAVDAAGNTASTTHTINIDNQVSDFRLTAVDDLSSLAAGADAVNATEALNGVTITGTVEPGSTVVVRWDGATLSNVSVDGNGVWTAVVPATMVPPGHDSVTVTATATDRFGNTSATLTQEVAIDRIVEPLARTGGMISGDGHVNAEEAAAGLTLTGTVETNARNVSISLNGGAPMAATITGGTWSITLPAGSLPEGSVDVRVSATDWVGNTRTVEAGSFNVDTIVPGAPVILNDSGEGSILTGILTQGQGNNFSYHAVGATGPAEQLIASSDPDGQVNDVRVAGVNAQQAYFPDVVPDGSYLVIRNEDAAGNEASTLYLRDTEAQTINLDRTGLQGFDFGTINLSSVDATLNITEAQVLALTGENKQLTIIGGSDDDIYLAGVTNITNAPNGFKLYELGTGGASVLIEEDVHVIPTGI